MERELHWLNGQEQMAGSILLVYFWFLAVRIFAFVIIKRHWEKAVNPHTLDPFFCCFLVQDMHFVYLKFGHWSKEVPHFCVSNKHPAPVGPPSVVPLGMALPPNRCAATAVPRPARPQVRPMPDPFAVFDVLVATSVLGFLAAPDVPPIAPVCRRWSVAASDEGVWGQWLRRDFGLEQVVGLDAEGRLLVCGRASSERGEHTCACVGESFIRHN